jgi:phytanoyl-CoA hydroxylase
MSLSGEQIRQFREEGYAIDPAFFTARETEAMLTELHRLCDDGFARNVTTEGDGETHSNARQNIQVIPLNTRSTLYRALPWHPDVLRAVTGLIGDPVMQHLDQSFIKPAHSGAPTNWHQDNAYFKIRDPLKGVGMWIAMHESTVANGTMRIIPGSHKEQYEHDRDPDSDHHIRCWPPEERAMHVELPPGGALFFCYGVAHATGSNETDHERAGVALHFLNVDYAQPQLLEVREGHAGRPILTGDQATDGEREFGAKVAGTWEQEVDRVLAG